MSRITIGMLAIALMSCSHANDPASTAVSPQVAFAGRTTHPDIAVANLHSRVAALERAAASRPGDLALSEALVELLMTRAAFLGRFSDFDRALDLATQATLAHPQDPAAHLLAARVLGAVHEFDAAGQSIAQAERLGADVTSHTGVVSIALGRPDHGVLQACEAAAEARPRYAELTALAVALSHAGDYERADVTYVRALAAYRDVSPFPAAWVQFQRGVMWAEMAGHPERALPLYEDAVRILPGYVVANVHLAELEALLGFDDDAIERLDSVMQWTEDPEPFGLLAELIREEQPALAQALIDEADQRYNRLLSRHPLAFADHAAEFYRGPGAVPERAAALACRNLANRQNRRARELARELADGCAN